jgi:hypothetical protein
MPRHIRTPPPRHPHYQRLVTRLAQELASPGEGPQPYILEEHQPDLHTRHVHVIWDDWKALPFEQRYDILLGAYKQAEGEEAAAEVMVASGLTAPDALGLGLLPYKVEAARRKNDSHPPEAYAEAAEAEAPRTLLGHLSHGLRYARLEDAEEAVRRLRKALPRSAWAVVREEPVES